LHGRYQFTADSAKIFRQRAALRCFEYDPVNRLRKWWKPGLFVLLALIAIQVGVSLLSRTASAKAFLTRQLELSFGRVVEVREYSLTLFPSPGLEAYAISVGEDPAFGQEYFLRADRLSASLRWTGLLRGRFELGTLRLERPSLILVRNSLGRWNLERWLPATSSEVSTRPVAQASGSQATPAHLLQKIDISDGRANFKLGEDKTTFAFIQVEGSVEQSAPGRWHLDLKAEPWRSGVPLQLAGTVRISGDVAGTSARLQPARLHLTWQKSSLADVFRLIGGQDFGVRGVFAAEATAESGGPSVAGAKNAAPGDWLFSVQARASGIHRWDLTERPDNPRVGVHLNGRWNPGAGSVNADELVLESPRSNLRGTASLNSIESTGAEVRVDSAGILAADVLDWYRAFWPDVREEIRTNQYFTGAATFRGWPLQLSDAAFSSPGGTLTVPGFAAPLEVKALRGGTQKRRLVIEPFSLIVPANRATAASGKLPNNANKELAGNVQGQSVFVTLSLGHDLATRTGGIRIEGQTTRVEDVLGIASAFGRRLQNGWELRGKATADLHWDWIAGKAPSWNGRADVSQGTLQVAGLNQPVQLESVRAEWRSAGRKFTLGKVAAFGAAWSGFVEQPALLPREFGESEIPAWTFQLQADHLDAAELDRWVGPRARPGWLQRLLPAGLGGSAPEPPSALLRRIRADGELSVDELAIERIKLRQFRAKARLDSLKLSVKNVQAKWAGGDVKGAADAVFSGKPRYEISASFDRVSIAQTPWLSQVADHLTGTASGLVQLHTEGIGREALLGNLAGKGDLRLAMVELRGWDVAGTLALGEWKPGISRWTAGAGTFHLSDGGFDLNSLRLASPSDEFLLKGSVSFTEETDLTAESHATGRNVRAESTIRFMQISGPINGPKVSLEKATAQQPGD
jgi:hypothetical protein